MKGRLSRRVLTAAAALLLPAGLAVLPATAASSAPQARADTAGAETAAAEHYKVGYYTQWSIYGRDYWLKDLAESGAAAELTHINYAFENVTPQPPYKCAMRTSRTGPVGDPLRGVGAGDQYADYIKRVGAANSVDGEADAWDQKLRGNFNQLRELKEKYPDLNVLVSLGGWTFSTFFSKIAATEQARETFVSSCIDMYIKGNLPAKNGAGGQGVAAGIFDGFDIDWEWPGSTGIGDDTYPNGNYVSPEDKHNFTLLLQEFREQLSAYSESHGGEKYWLSAFLPADPAKIDAGYEVPKIFDYLDYATIQGYDLHGAWEDTTNHQGQLYVPEDDPAPPERRFSVNKTIQYYLDKGAPASQLVLGVPFYGRGWANVQAGDTNGLYQPGEAAPGRFPDGADGVGEYEWLMQSKNLEVYYDEEAVASWGYGNGEMWTFDTPKVLAKKMQYLKDKNLKGVMIWELSGDYQGRLMGAINANLP